MFREQSLRLLIVHASMDDDVVALLPVDRCSNLMLVTQLESVQDTDDFVKVAASDSRIGEKETDGFLWVDDEYISDLSRMFVRL